MKIRLGFVSNSSSESFLIYGALLSEADVDAAYEKLKGTNLHIEYGDPNFRDGEVYVGRSWGNIGDDETGREFKEGIENKLTEIFGTGIVCATHSQSWYNG